MLNEFFKRLGYNVLFSEDSNEETEQQTLLHEIF